MWKFIWTPWDSLSTQIARAWPCMTWHDPHDGNLNQKLTDQLRKKGMAEDEHPCSDGIACYTSASRNYGVVDLHWFTSSNPDFSGFHSGFADFAFEAWELISFGSQAQEVCAATGNVWTSGRRMLNADLCDAAWPMTGLKTHGFDHRILHEDWRDS